MWKHISIIIGRMEQKYGELHLDMFLIHLSQGTARSSSKLAILIAVWLSFIFQIRYWPTAHYHRMSDTFVSIIMNDRN